ncbi:hypothetical protein HMPREF9211_1204 [Lactobacillus iners LactinV 01V1-a]|uniref:Uncharacterized protein n=1 Tax=Lactobacillus iners LactinV 01V1-a TaxID=879297 RepID=E1NS54_9LACO|nr:hypothetical protein HMPREF9211_1204 [Lactobacillus iners LactinV 01V1-a]
MLAPIPINVTGKISGNLYRLAMVKYKGINVKTVISLVKNIAEITERKVKITVNLRVLDALAVNLYAKTSKTCRYEKNLNNCKHRQDRK